MGQEGLKTFSRAGLWAGRWEQQQEQAGDKQCKGLQFRED